MRSGRLILLVCCQAEILLRQSKNQINFFSDLSNNDIRDIPFGALRGYPALERLLLASNQISRVSLQALADMPRYGFK